MFSQMKQITIVFERLITKAEDKDKVLLVSFIIYQI